MFKPANLRKVFWGLLGLGAMRTIGDLSMFYIAYFSNGRFAEGLPLFLKNLLANFSAAALTYILYWFSRRKYGEETKGEAQENPQRPLRPDEEGISDEDLGKIVSKVTWVLYILSILGLLIYFKLNRK